MLIITYEVIFIAFSWHACATVVIYINIKLTTILSDTNTPTPNTHIHTRNTHAHLGPIKFLF